MKETAQQAAERFYPSGSHDFNAVEQMAFIEGAKWASQASPLPISGDKSIQEIANKWYEAYETDLEDKIKNSYEAIYFAIKEYAELKNGEVEKLVGVLANVKEWIDNDPPSQDILDLSKEVDEALKPYQSVKEKG